MSHKKTRKGRPESGDEADLAEPVPVPETAATDGAEAPAPESTPEYWRDQYLRTLADLQNLRRRAAQEVEERTVQRLEGLLEDLLRVDDYFAAALAQVPAGIQQAEGGAAFVAGVTAIRQALDAVLTVHGVHFIVPGADAAFDPAEHEAVEVLQETGLEAPRLDLLARGCRIGRRILRPAKVRLVRPQPPA